MHHTKMFSLSAILIPLLFSGCAVISKEVSFNDIQNSVQDRTKIKVSWNLDDKSKEDVKERINELVTKPFTAEVAAEIALLSSKRIQAIYENLGIARAELLQAGLLRNPIFEVRPRFASSGGGTNIELGLTEPIFDILFIPLRQRVAESKLESVKAAIANEVITNVSETKKAFYELQSALQMLEVRQSILSASEASYFTTKKIHEAGNTTDLKLGTEKALFEETKIERINAESDVEEKKQRLASMIGLDSAIDKWEIAPHLKTPPKETLDVKTLEELALNKNMELISSKLEIETLGKELGLSTPLLLSNGELGVVSERDLDGSWVTGPNLLIPLPIFDQGQGYNEEISSKLRQAIANYEAMVTVKKTNIRATFVKMEKARAKAILYRDAILPLRSQLTEETQTRYDAMLIGIFDLLLAKQSEIQAGANYIEALKDFWVMRSELEKEVGIQIDVPIQEEFSDSKEMKSRKPTHDH